MKTLLTLLAIANMNTIDTHATNYEPTQFRFDGLTYQIEEDYSVSMEYKPYTVNQDGKEFLVNEDKSLTPLVNLIEK